MNPDNPQPQQQSAQPIHDIAPLSDTSLGNPEHMAQIPVHQAPSSPRVANPLVAAQSPAPAAVPPQSGDLEKVLKEVNKDVKAGDKKPHKASKPTLVVTIAIIVGLGLCAAAYYAYSSAN